MKRAYDRWSVPNRDEPIPPVGWPVDAAHGPPAANPLPNGHRAGAGDGTADRHADMCAL